MTMFAKRHYKWLANFAGHHLTQDQWEALASELYNTNPNYKPMRFLQACKDAALDHKRALQNSEAAQ